MLAHVPSFGRNAGGSPDFLAYLLPKACQQRVLSTGVPRCFGVARSASLPPVSGSPLTMSPAWHLLPQCPGYGHWVSYGCVALVFGTGFRGSPASPGCSLGCVCLGTGFGFAPPILSGVCGVCAWAWVFPALSQSWLMFWGVCVCVCAPRVPWLGLLVRVSEQVFWLYPAICGWRVRCALVLGLHPANPFRAVGVRVFVCALR